MRRRDWTVTGVAFVLLVLLIAALLAGLLVAAWFVLTHLPVH